MLRLAEFNLVKRHCDQKIVVLADDVTGELDQYNRDLFFESVENADQRFFTFTSFPDYPKLSSFCELPVKMQ